MKSCEKYTCRWSKRQTIWVPKHYTKQYFRGWTA